MKLIDVHIDRYGPLPTFSHRCDDNFEVFYGPNESGKTLLLEAVLKLLTPDIDSVLPQVSRVDESPSGYVVIENGGDEQKLGAGTTLDDISDLTPRHLRNIFVIRDSDLQLSDEHKFYDSLTQQIGEIYTSEIEAIQNRLLKTGRLTSLRGRSLSTSRDNDYAADTRDNAAKLTTDIRNYIDQVETNDIATVEREFVAVITDLQQCNEALAVQEAAETWNRYETLAERIDTYKEASEQLDDGISQSTLKQIQQRDRAIREADDKIEELGAKRSSLREERAQFDAEKEEVEADLTSLVLCQP